MAPVSTQAPVCLTQIQPNTRRERGEVGSHTGGGGKGWGNKQPKNSGHLFTLRVKGNTEEEKSQRMKSQAQPRAHLPRRQSIRGQDTKQEQCG